MTEKCAADGNKGFGHEVSRMEIGWAARSSMTIKRPSLQIGQRLGSGRGASRSRSSESRGLAVERIATSATCQ